MFRACCTAHNRSEPSVVQHCHDMESPESSYHGIGSECYECSECSECPVCFVAMREEDSVMRCDGAGGQHHYFHHQCLASWIREKQLSHQKPTCPICRGNIQVHPHRLREFLAAGNGTHREELQAFADELQEDTIGDAQGWTNAVFTQRNVSRAAGVCAGFFVGVTGMPVKGYDVGVNSDSDFGFAYNCSLVCGLVVYGAVQIFRALKK